MDMQFGATFDYKLIYVFALNDTQHEGLLKIGDATIHTVASIDKLPPNCHDLNQAALQRIKQYTTTVGVNPILLHTELAVRTEKDDCGNMVLRAFRDHSVHEVLDNSGFHKRVFPNNGGKEWYEIDLATVLKAIDAVKACRKNISQTNLPGRHTPIIFRPEQEKVIHDTLTQFKNGNNMLWNAKMRFGKTLCALQVVKDSGFRKTLIFTHRPVVDAGWHEDFDKIFYDSPDYEYGSKQSGCTLDDLIASGKHFIYFASIQDLRGSAAVGGKYDKNDLVFTTNWDFVVVDEAHEGTTTTLGEDVITSIVKADSGYGTKFLALSGTPFNILNRYESNIYTWDYVMEQSQKAQWDVSHFGDSNPYEELPELRIYTYDLGDIITKKEYVELEDKAFNFKEFFRVWVGDIRYDHKQMPKGVSSGEFVHRDDVWSFLNLITKEDTKSKYPYATKEYRDLFKHSLWMVPGVKEAAALSKLMRMHPVFGSGAFNIVNVAGQGDEEEKSETALEKVKTAIKEAGDTYTITLSCGRLTTGVTVKEWTAVFMLHGTFSTSAANYMQTIFRVQSPCNQDGKIKSSCYVFDFAPDRTLKMVAESVAMSHKHTNDTERSVLRDFLNFCPVIAVSGTVMKKYDTNKLLQQLKRAYADRAVRNGFDDQVLYNDELLKLGDVDIAKFNSLKKIIAKAKADKGSREIDINSQGFTDEKYDDVEKIRNKPKKLRTPEEEALLQKEKELREKRKAAIIILRAISIRMPLLIFGADVDVNEDITMSKLVESVDDQSWAEFMPKGVTKQLFRDFSKYYDKEVFVAAGRKIRSVILAADELPVVERIKKITELFDTFKNPDKETVLTPWRMVNMHLSECLGGFDFYNEQHNMRLESPRFVDNGAVTKETVANPNCCLLEINSKSGLYPLYAAYSIFMAKCNSAGRTLSDAEQNELWLETIRKNIFVICKTQMAKHITQRTLTGFHGAAINAHYFEDLINMMQNKPQQFVDRVRKPSFWNMGTGGKMEFNAVVGNPPYQIMDNGNGSSATPVYNYFVSQGMALEPNYLSMLIPARWYSGGKGLDQFRNSMLNDNHIAKITDFTSSLDCFPTVDVAGGICYFLWDYKYNGPCLFKNINNGAESVVTKYLNEYQTLIRYPQADSIIKKVLAFNEARMSDLVSTRKPFGLATNVKPTHSGDIMLRYTGGVGKYHRSDIKAGTDIVDKWKVMLSYLSAEHAGQPDKNGMFRVISTLEVLPPKYVCTETYLLAGTFETEEEATNCYEYLRTRFARFLLAQIAVSQHITRTTFSFVPVQDFTKRWDDNALFDKYGLIDEERSFIVSMIKVMTQNYSNEEETADDETE